MKISLYKVAKDQGGQILEINETSSANGWAVNRSLPYGHYDLSARTSDGWVLHHGSRLNVEFEKGLDVVLVAPTANKTAKLVINSDLGPPSAAVNELRFGELKEVNGRGYSGTYAPEPVAKPMDGEKETKKEGASTMRASPVNGESYDSFPTIVNGIEYVGVEIDTEITRSIPQAAPGLKHIHTTWEWWPTESDDFKRRYLVANNQARGLMEDKDLHISPVDGSQFFNLPGPSYRVGASRLELGEPTALPMELDIPAGDVKVYIGRFYGKPNAAALAVLNWRQQEKKSELWLKALIFRESAWIERLMKTTDWLYSAPGEGSYIVSGHLLRREVSLKPGETLEVSLSPKRPDPKADRASEARTLDDITSIYNEQTHQLRTELFNPPIPNLTTAQMRTAMLDAAEQHRK